MFCATITITDITQPAANLLNLLKNAGGNGLGTPGYLVKTAAQFNSLTTLGGVSYVSIQASPRNGNGTYIYEGDEGVTNNGTCQGKELTPGTIDTHQAYPNSTFLSEIYIAGSVNGVIANVEFSYS